MELNPEDETAPPDPAPPAAGDPPPTAHSGPTPSTALWLTCPECGAAAQISWKRLDRRFQCRECKKVYYVSGQGRFSEVKLNGPRTRRRNLFKHLLTTAVALAVGAILITLYHFLWSRDSGPPPLPKELEARGRLWSQAWLTDDHYLMRRLTDPVNERALFVWVRRHPAPHLPVDPKKKGGAPVAEIEAHVDRAAANAAVLLIRIKAPSLPTPVEVRQKWVERGEGWYFVPF